LEVERVSGVPLSRSLAPAPHPVFDRQLLVLDVPRGVLYDRIDRRVERMFSSGIIEETAAALAAPGGIGPTAIQAAGYGEAAAVVAGQLDRGAAILRTQQRTRQLAKRQLTWFRSFRSAIWIAT
jgi:tRNA dimethylallyltransferase